MTGINDVQEGAGDNPAADKSVNAIDKNPQDSLQNYFDDLLLGSGLDDFEAALEAPLSTLTKPIAAVQFPAPAPTKTPDSVTKTQVKPAVPKPYFADPIIEKKENLQKLLHSVQPKIALASSEKIAIAVPTAFVSDATEIQEWDTASSSPPDIITQADPAIAQASAKQTFHMPGVDWLANGLPSWAQTRFDVLLVKVSGLTLAVPLISLGQIQPITDELAHIFGQADWFIGIQPTLTGKIRMVNTAKFVMPERYDENFVKTAKLLVSINGVPWGLAVDSVNQPISLEPEAIKWRTDRSKRPWLAGIIKEQMCALLDIPMIGQMLMESDKNLTKNFL